MGHTDRDNSDSAVDFTDISADTDTTGHISADFLTETLRTHIPQLTEAEISQLMSDLIDPTADSEDEQHLNDNYDTKASSIDLEASSGHHMSNLAGFPSSAI